MSPFVTECRLTAFPHTGADPQNRTARLILTKDAFRHQNFIGHELEAPTGATRHHPLYESGAFLKLQSRLQHGGPNQIRTGDLQRDKLPGTA